MQESNKELQEAYDLMSKYIEKMACERAYLIDKNIGLVINPKPDWLPNWLYKKIIKETVTLIQIK